LRSGAADKRYLVKVIKGHPNMSESSIYIALLSLVISFATFYVTQLRPPRVGLLVGSTIGLNHQEEGFSLYFPLTFNNTALQPGLVNRCSVVFTRADAPTSHYIEWTEFRKRDDDKKIYVIEEFAGPLQVEGRSSISKLVWFRWRKGALALTEGKYSLEVIVWTENSALPTIREKHELFIGATEAAALADFKINKRTRIEWLGIDKQIESNKLVTNHELEKLLG
jgi:hypothetical protein